MGAVVCVVGGGGDGDGGAGGVAGGGVDLVVAVLDAGAGVRAGLRRVVGGERDGHGLVGPVAAVVDARVGVFSRRGGGRRLGVDVRGRGPGCLGVAGFVAREVL